MVGGQCLNIEVFVEKEAEGKPRLISTFWLVEHWKFLYKKLQHAKRESF